MSKPWILITIDGDKKWQLCHSVMYNKEAQFFDILIIRTRTRRNTTKGLVTNYGERGATKREGGGACEVLPLQKGVGGVFSHAEGGGGIKCFGVVFMQ